jgi:L-fuconolactonase
VKVDAHHHLWNPGERLYPWMAEIAPELKCRFDLTDLRDAMSTTPVVMTVVVQTVSELAETESFLSLAGKSHETIAGVVGWVDLTDGGVGDTLAALVEGEHGSLLVGIRHQVHDEPDPRWLLRADVQRGLRAVGDAGLVFDLLVRPRELPAAIEAVELLPELHFVLDHLGKPPIAQAMFEPWASLVTHLASHQNVSCKLSGLVTEAGPDAVASDIALYTRHAIDAFGANRIMFGSDWPVCTSRRSYRGVYELALELTADLAVGDRDAIFGGNAVRTYRLL